MRNCLLAIPLLAAGLLAAGCTASSSPSAAAAPVSPSGAASSAAAGAASPAAPAPATGSVVAAAGARACTSADLAVSLGGGTGPGMDQDHTGLQLRNIGSSACTLFGYPGVSWVGGADGHQVGAAATRELGINGTEPAEKTVTLAPGALASAPIDFVDAAAYPSDQCHAVPVRGLRVYPPGEKAAIFFPMGTPGQYGICANAKDTTLSVGYLQAGAQPA
jgi:hypothetical protein